MSIMMALEESRNHSISRLCPTSHICEASFGDEVGSRALQDAVVHMAKIVHQSFPALRRLHLHLTSAVRILKYLSQFLGQHFCSMVRHAYLDVLGTLR